MVIYKSTLFKNIAICLAFNIRKDAENSLSVTIGYFIWAKKNNSLKGFNIINQCKLAQIMSNNLLPLQGMILIIPSYQKSKHLKITTLYNQ